MFKQILIAIDQLFNTFFGGYADETLSARAWRTQHWIRFIIDFIFFFDKQHCFNSYLSECERRQFPHEYKHCK